jgi:23S rRNA (uracil747-C5)-methyltransferase
MDQLRANQTPAQSNYESAECAYFTSGRCSSCSLLSQSPGDRLSVKITRLLETLSRSGVTPLCMEEVVIPREVWSSRHKIKMNVAGSTQEPVIGLSNAEGRAEDLSSCPLMPDQVQGLLAGLKSTIRDAQVPPYDIPARCGELKGIIVMVNREGSQGILRFVLRSTEAVPRIRKVLPSLRKQHPWLRVVSCNIQPLHAAIPEGPEELLLTPEDTIEELYSGIPVTFAPQSFMQVTPDVAEALYRRAAAHVREQAVVSALDLFCGVGGFSFAVAPFVQSLTGVELSPKAIESASRTALRLKHSHLNFVSSDVDAYLDRGLGISSPDLVIANPPRRGLSSAVKRWVIDAAPRHFVYSSCNPETFCRDAAELAESYILMTLAPFDMFPLTPHIEVLGFFAKR